MSGSVMVLLGVGFSVWICGFLCFGVNGSVFLYLWLLCIGNKGPCSVGRV